LQTKISATTPASPSLFLTLFYVESCKQNILLNLIFMDPCIVDYSIEIPTRCSFVMEFIIPNFIEGSTCFERHTVHHQEL